MSFLGNLLWFVFGGFFMGLCWLIAGAIWCVTIIGIPVGIQCLKLAQLSFFPFGKQIVYSGRTMSFLCNLLWLLFSGLELALIHCGIGVCLCVTIIGIPFGLQQFKLAKLALFPFGAEIRSI